MQAVVCPSSMRSGEFWRPRGSQVGQIAPVEAVEQGARVLRLDCASLRALVVASLPRSRWGQQVPAPPPLDRRPLGRYLPAPTGPTRSWSWSARRPPFGQRRQHVPGRNPPLCDTLIHDLHEGGKTARLRDSRCLLAVSSAGPPISAQGTGRSRDRRRRRSRRARC